MNLPADRHVLPLGDLVEHDESRECWCGPRLERRCPECADRPLSARGCWRCKAGWIKATAEDDATVLVIHNAADGRK